MPTGKVKWFDPKKGYGFILGEQGQDVFVHYTNIIGDGFRTLKDGETVSYELVKTEKGHQARSPQGRRGGRRAPGGVTHSACLGLIAEDTFRWPGRVKGTVASRGRGLAEGIGHSIPAGLHAGHFAVPSAE
jgi:CspA family cold shock protein